MRFLILALAILSPAVARAEEPWSISREHAVTRDAMPIERKSASKRHNSGNILIRFYQDYVSPLSGATCHYSPTCSRYTSEVIAEFGMLKGMVMGMDRLIRCHPGQREHPIDLPFEY